MSDEKSRSFSGQIGTLGGCLIEGDSEQKARERKVKRRALTISVGLQSAVIVALVLVPLLGRTEKLPFTLFTPIPNYYHSTPKPIVETRPNGPVQTGECVVCFKDHLSPRPAMQSTVRQTVGQIVDPTIGVGVGSGEPTGSDIFNTRPGPVAPEDPDKNKKKRISVGGAVQQAMLVNRVAPMYPALARQLHRAGQVHIRALIAVDGSIESLQAIDGDPLLIKSALDAVGQWRYRPTMLNGNPVEVETIITVIYTLNQ